MAEQSPPQTGGPEQLSYDVSPAGQLRGTNQQTPDGTVEQLDAGSNNSAQNAALGQGAPAASQINVDPSFIDGPRVRK